MQQPAESGVVRCEVADGGIDADRGVQLAGGGPGEHRLDDAVHGERVDRRVHHVGADRLGRRGAERE
jgi:hypothetical protein